MNIRKLPIDQLKPATYNPRKDLKPADKEYQKIRKSLENFGYVDPIIVNNDMTIIGGHQRTKVLRELGYSEVDCVVVDIDKEQEKALNIALNKISGEWDQETLKELLEELSATDIDMELTGFDFDEIEQLMNDGQQKEVEEDDFDTEQALDDITEPITKRGDVWRLGRHRLMCGDSTSVDDAEKLMDGKKATLGFNDPPYGMKKEAEGILNDNLSYDDLLAFNMQWIPLQFSAIADNGSFYCWGIDEPLMDIYAHIIKPYIKQNKATFRNLLTWNKSTGQGQMVDSHRMYATADEKCLFVMMGVQGFNTNTDNYFEGWEPVRSYLKNEIDKIGWKVPDIKKICGVGMYGHWFTKSQFLLIPEEHYKKLQEAANNEVLKRDYEEIKRDYEEIKRDYEEIKRDYYSTRAYFNNTHDNMNNVWHFDRHKKDGTEGGHASPKPIPLCARAIKSSCPENEIVVDFFGGSGSTLIACEQTDRVCYMMELDEKYCDVIIKRWETLTGQKAELITGGESDAKTTSSTGEQPQASHAG